MFTRYRLPTDLKAAVARTKDIAKQFEHQLPSDFLLSSDVSVNGVQRTYTTRRVTLHSYTPDAFDCFMEDIISQIIRDISYCEETKQISRHEYHGCHLDITERRKIVRPCPICKMQIKENYASHVEICGEGKVCSICYKVVHTHMSRHRESCGNRNYDCRNCGLYFHTGAQRTAHEKKCRRAENLPGPSSKRPAADTDEGETRADQTAIGGTFRIKSINVDSRVGSDYEGALYTYKDQIQRVIRDTMGNGTTVILGLEANMKKLVDDDTATASFISSPSVVLTSTDINAIITNQYSQILEKIDTFLRNGSGWIVDRVTFINIHQSR